MLSAVLIELRNWIVGLLGAVAWPMSREKTDIGRGGVRDCYGAWRLQDTSLVNDESSEALRRIESTLKDEEQVHKPGCCLGAPRRVNALNCF